MLETERKKIQGRVEFLEVQDFCPSFLIGFGGVEMWWHILVLHFQGAPSLLSSRGEDASERF